MVGFICKFLFLIYVSLCPRWLVSLPNILQIVKRVRYEFDDKQNITKYFFCFWNLFVYKTHMQKLQNDNLYMFSLYFSMYLFNIYRKNVFKIKAVYLF